MEWDCIDTWNDGLRIGKVEGKKDIVKVDEKL